VLKKAFASALIGALLLAGAPACRAAAASRASALPPFGVEPSDAGAAAPALPAPTLSIGAPALSPALDAPALAPAGLELPALSAPTPDALQPAAVSALESAVHPALAAPSAGAKAPAEERRAPEAAALSALSQDLGKAKEGGAQEPVLRSAFDASPKLASHGEAALAVGGSPSPGTGLSAAGAENVFQPQLVETPIPGDPLGVTVHRLSNGFTVYLSPNSQEPRVHAEIVARAGSRDDPLDNTGMAHYLEHVQFKGTRRLGTTDYAAEKPHLDRIEALYDEYKRTADPARRRDIYAEIDRESQAAARFAVANEYDQAAAAGGFTDVNAHTDFHETAYEAGFPANRAELWARLESDRLADPVYRLFLPELEAVYEEFNKYRDDPDSALRDATFAALFKGHPYGREIIGLGEHLKNPSISAMKAFFKGHYRPSNMAVVLSGDFERGAMLALLERTFGRLEPGPVSAAPAAAPRPLRGVERAELRRPGEEEVQVAWRLPGLNHPDEDALVVASMLLSNDATGILDLSVNAAQKAKDSGVDFTVMNEAGAFIVRAQPKEGQTLEQAEAVVLRAVDRLKAGRFSQADLDAVIADIERQSKKRLERNDRRVDLIRASYVGGQEWKDAVLDLDRIRRVTKADVARVAGLYLGPDRAVVYRRKGTPASEPVAKPVFTPPDIDPRRQSAFFHELTSLPAAPVSPRFLRSGADYRTLDRAWGRLYWAPNPVNDLFSLELRFDLDESRERKLPLALQLLDVSGAGDMPVGKFERALYRLAAKMDVRADDDGLSVRLSGPEANLDEILRLALLRFSRPKVSTRAFRELVAIERGDREDRKGDEQDVFEALKDFATLGADSPFLKELTAGELDSLSERQLTAVLRNVFGLRRSVLYTGNRSPEDVAKALSAAQGRRRYRDPPAAPPRRLLVPARSRVVFVHQEGLSQAMIGVRAADGPFQPRNRVEVNLYDVAMDGGMAGIYFQEVREARAMAYTAKGGYYSGPRRQDDAYLWAYAATQGDKAVDAARLLGELMRRPPLTDERLAKARRDLEQQLRTTAPRLSAIPQAVLDWENLGYARNPLPGLFRRLPTRGPEDVRRFAARFAGKPLTFFVLADRSRVDLAGLRALGDFEERTPDELYPF